MARGVQRSAGRCDVGAWNRRQYACWFTQSFVFDVNELSETLETKSTVT